MKKHIFALVVLAFSFQTTNAQWWSSNKKVKGNGNLTTEKRTVPEYDAVNLNSSFDVELVAGNEGNLTIEAESNLMEYITTEVSNGKLKISVEEGINLDTNEEIKITVPFEEISSVSLTGSGDIIGKDRIKSENFSVSITGSGDIELELQAREVKGNITGSGDLSLSGSTSNFETKITGSGDFDASKLKAEKVEAVISGSGDIQVFASQELRTRISGSGDVYYAGNPKKEDFKTSGSGSVSKM